MIDIGTRWSSNDVLGRMEEAGKYNESFVLLRWMRMMKLSAPMFILQNITRNYVLKQTKVFGWPSICRNRSRPKGYYSPNRLSCASNLPILQGKT